MFEHTESIPYKIPNITAGSETEPVKISVFVAEINKLIDQYNHTNDKEMRLGILRKMQDEIEDINHQYRISQIRQSPQYQKFRSELFIEIKEQYGLLGVDSLVKDPENASPLSELIANMSPRKVDQFYKCLKGNFSRLHTLYLSTDESTEAKAFRSFLKSHQFNVLSSGNTVNYLITNNHGGKEVLRVDRRLDVAKSAEAHLQRKSPHLFAAISVERQALDGNITVLKFYEHGNLTHYREQGPHTLKHTSHIFQQMALHFLDMQKAGCIFSDAKLDNWLINKEGRIDITDTKSLKFTHEGKYFKNLPENAHLNCNVSPTELLESIGFTIPENGQDAIDADKVHAFLLGKNLYYFFTGTDRLLDKELNANLLHHNPFQVSAGGPLYKELILGLTSHDPTKRIRVQDALELLKVIEKLSQLDNDEKITELFRKTVVRLQDPTSTSAQRSQEVNQLLDVTCALEQSQPLWNELQAIAQNYHDRAGRFTVGMHAKAHKIEKALAKLTVMQRAELTEENLPLELKEALTAKRILDPRPKPEFDFKSVKQKYKMEVDKLKEEEEVPHRNSGISLPR